MKKWACMGLIPWRAVRVRTRAMAVVEHGKVWAGSLSRLKGRADPYDSKYALQSSPHRAKL
jgi:hypothetical protein